jgi:hypothetical protein
MFAALMMGRHFSICDLWKAASPQMQEFAAGKL